eukprot:354926-Chlamydomonas_euryale.AAC.3
MPHTHTLWRPNFGGRGLPKLESGGQSHRGRVTGSKSQGQSHRVRIRVGFCECRMKEAIQQQGAVRWQSQREQTDGLMWAPACACKHLRAISHPYTEHHAMDPERAEFEAFKGVYNSGQFSLRQLNGSGGVSPLMRHVNDRQVQKGKEGTRAGRGKET